MISCSDAPSDNSKATDKAEITAVSDNVALAEGKKIVMGTFKILGSKLKKAMQKGGAIEGIEVCSSEATTLTDSISKAYGIGLKRISQKNRNPNNSPSASEDKILSDWSIEINRGNKIKPTVLREGDDITVIAPIRIGSKCVVCHGDEKFVTPEVMEKIKHHYPEDKATGYKEKDLRGAWVITFPKDYFKE